MLNTAVVSGKILYESIEFLSSSYLNLKGENYKNIQIGFYSNNKNINPQKFANDIIRGLIEKGIPESNIIKQVSFTQGMGLDSYNPMGMLIRGIKIH